MTAPGGHRILIVDEHDLFRVGLASVLATREDLEVVGQASSAKGGIRLSAELRPDVILMDVRLSDLDGPVAARAMLEQDGSARIVALTTLATESDVAVAVDAGMCGYLLKDSPVDDIVAAIHAAADGMAWLSPPAALALLDGRRGHRQSGDMAAPDDDLSPREVELLHLLARRLHNDEIAAELSMSARTLQNHVSSILSKLMKDLALWGHPGENDAQALRHHTRATALG